MGPSSRVPNFEAVDPSSSRAPNLRYWTPKDRDFLGPTPGLDPVDGTDLRSERNPGGLLDSHRGRVGCLSA